jgi:phosphate starvation-inducible protein PhoH and related proteins
LEKQIFLESIDPLEFYGVNNSKINLLKNHFPKLNIVARGNTIFVKGEEKEVGSFEKKLGLLLDQYYQFNILGEDFINQILLNDFSGIEINPEDEKDVLVYGNNGKPVRARTPNQRLLVEECRNNDLIFAIGPAGTGKTYTAIALAVRALRNREIKRIVLSRPAVEAGERLGFLPGDLKEKIDPYLQPLYDALMDMIPAKKLEEFIRDGVIQIAPLAFMRGRTLGNAFVILDEAQNTTFNQLKMFLTRMGLNARFIVTGDITQIDLPDKDSSGLLHALKILDKIEGISIVRFDKRDIVRHRLVRDIVDAYEKFYRERDKKEKTKTINAESGGRKQRRSEE